MGQDVGIDVKQKAWNAVLDYIQDLRRMMIDYAEYPWIMAIDDHGEHLIRVWISKKSCHEGDKSYAAIRREVLDCPLGLGVDELDVIKVTIADHLAIIRFIHDIYEEEE